LPAVSVASCQIALIGRDRMRRQPPFGGQVLQVGIDRRKPCIRTSAAPTSCQPVEIQVPMPA
jgi:hypothetical protein